MRIFFVLALLLGFVPQAEACHHRFGLGAGLVHIEDPSSTNFDLSAEYECRFDKILGLGGFVNYIFADPGITLVGAPELFVHPLGGSFYVAASPLAEFGSSVGTHFGAHLATRIPLPLGPITLIPSAAVDFIRGTRIWWLGLGIGI